jgi:hypothetical protein
LGWDIINNVRPKDIDMIIDVNNQQMRDICLSLDIDFNSYKQIKFFDDIFDIKMINRVSNESVENDVNSLYYDFKKKIIIDPTATGLTNCLNMRFRIVQSSFGIINHNMDTRCIFLKCLKMDSN